MIHEILTSIQFVEDLFEHFELEIKVHPWRTVEAYEAGVDLDTRVLSFGTRSIARATKIDAVSRDERPIAIEDDAFQLPVLPSTFADLSDMRSLSVTSSLSQLGKLLAEAFIHEQLHDFSFDEACDGWRRPKLLRAGILVRAVSPLGG